MQGELLLNKKSHIIKLELVRLHCPKSRTVSLSKATNLHKKNQNCFDNKNIIYEQSHNKEKNAMKNESDFSLFILSHFLFCLREKKCAHFFSFFFFFFFFFL
jgi:hypothetical protein